MFVFAADYPFLDILWTMIIFFCWVVWIWLPIMVFSRPLPTRRVRLGQGSMVRLPDRPAVPRGCRPDPIAEGKGMTERRVQEMQGARRRSSTPTCAPSPRRPAVPGGSADEIKKAKALLDSGAIHPARVRAAQGEGARSRRGGRRRPRAGSLIGAGVSRVPLRAGGQGDPSDIEEEPGMRPKRPSRNPGSSRSPLGLTGAALAPCRRRHARRTTTGYKQLLKQQSDASMAAPAAGVPTIIIDPSPALRADRRHRRLDHRLVGAPAGPSRRTATRSCATCSTPRRDRPRATCASRWARRDFVDGPHYTYDDLPVGGPTSACAGFSVAHDEMQILPLLRQALRQNPNLKVMGTPWSPPAWMKDQRRALRRPLHRRQARSTTRTRSTSSSSCRPTSARACPSTRVTLQNEPQNRFPNHYPGMDFRDPEEARLIKSVGPAFQKAGIDTKILGYDHNWSLHPNDVGHAAGRGPEPEYAEGAARRPGGQALAGRHRVPLLLGRPELAVGPQGRATRTATSTSRSARARSPATRRRRSRTRCTGTRAS